MMSELGIVMPKMRTMTSELVVMSALYRNIRAMSEISGNCCSGSTPQI